MPRAVVDYGAALDVVRSPRTTQSAWPSRVGMATILINASISVNAYALFVGSVAAAPIDDSQRRFCQYTDSGKKNESA